MKLAALASALCLLAAGNALAAPSSCKDAGSATAKPVLYYTDDPAVFDGLDITLKLGLEPATFPSQDIARNSHACIRASFTVGDIGWSLFGDDSDQPPRWATTPGGKLTYFLAAMPPADEAHIWAESQRSHPVAAKTATFNGMMYALVGAQGDQRHVYGFFDRIPDDARLVQAMQSAIAGRTPVVLEFDVKTLKTDEDRMIEPLTLRFVESRGKIVPADNAAPDGVAFDGGPDGSATARRSGLACPAALGDLRRSALFSTGAADGSEEAGCRYVSENARMAVVATRQTPGQDIKNAMTLVIAAPLAFSDGQPAETPQPAKSPVGVTGAASFFKTPDGASEGIWGVLRKDGWFVEIYALYAPGDETAVADAVTALSKANPGTQ